MNTSQLTVKQQKMLSLNANSLHLSVYGICNLKNLAYRHLPSFKTLQGNVKKTACQLHRDVYVPVYAYCMLFH